MAALKGVNSGPPKSPTCCPVTTAPAPWPRAASAAAAAGEGAGSARPAAEPTPASVQEAADGSPWRANSPAKVRAVERPRPRLPGAVVQKQPAQPRHDGHGMTVCGQQLIHFRPSLAARLPLGTLCAQAKSGSVKDATPAGSDARARFPLQETAKLCVYFS